MQFRKNPLEPALLHFKYPKSNEYPAPRFTNHSSTNITLRRQEVS